MDLKPGMSIELEILDDGKIKYAYDGPLRAPPPRRLGPESRPLKPKRKSQSGQPETPEILDAPLGSEAHERLVARIAQGIRNDPQAMSLLEQIKSLNKELEHTKGIARKSADPTLLATQKHLEELRREYDERIQAISDKTRERMQRQKNLPPSEVP